MCPTCSPSPPTCNSTSSPRARPHCFGTRSRRRCTRGRYPKPRMPDTRALAVPELGACTSSTRAPADPGGSGRLDNPRGETVPLGAQALRRVLELAASKVRRPPPALCSPRRPRWPGTRVPRCSDTTLSAPPPNEHPAWSWDETPRVYRRGALCGEWMPRCRPCAQRRAQCGVVVQSVVCTFQVPSSHFRRNRST